MLLLLDVNEFKNPSLFTAGLALVSEERRQKIQRLQREDSKRLSLGAGLLLRYAFASVGRLDLYETIQKTPSGKPYLPQHEYYFSLSHSGAYAACAFSNAPIGCDLEAFRKQLPKSLRKIFSPQEMQLFTALQEEERCDFFFRLWTGKESVSKFLGKGLTLPFHSFSVMQDDGLKNCIEWENTAIFLKSFSREGFALCLAGTSPAQLDSPQQMDVDQLLLL